MKKFDRDRALVAVAVVACLTFTLYFEHWLAAEVLEVPGLMAWAFPVALDAYVLAAMRTHQDRAWAFGLSAAAQLAAGLSAVAEPVPTEAVGAMRAGFGIAITMVLWRVHVILHALNERSRVTVTVEETVTLPDHRTALADQPDRTTGPDQLGSTGPDRPGLPDRTTGPDQADHPDRVTGPDHSETPDRTTGPDPVVQLVRTGPTPSGRVKELLPHARRAVTAFEREHGRQPGQKKLAELLRGKGHSCSIDVAVSLLTEIRDQDERRAASG